MDAGNSERTIGKRQKSGRIARQVVGRTLGMAILAVCLSGRVGAQGAPVVPKTGLHFGADVYLGMTNASGIRARSNDGQWAGYGSALPSNLSLNWQGARADSARVAVGIGDMYTTRGVTVKQPVEAFYTRQAGQAGALTLGKYFVPFAGYEWEYESKWGAMLSGQRGLTQYAASLNWNPTLHAANGYLHLARNFGPRTTVGVSGAWGRGLMNNSSHNAAFALDLAHSFKGFQFNSEVDVAHSANGAFAFGFGKLTWTRGGRWAPFVGMYSWRDDAGEMGAFHSVVAGTAYQVAPHLTLEAGIGQTGKRSGAFWLQSHVSL